MQRGCTSRHGRAGGAEDGELLCLLAQLEPTLQATTRLPPTFSPPSRPAQARKQRRAAEQVAPLLEAAARDLEYLAEVEVQVAQMGGATHLAALQEVQVRRWEWRCCGQAVPVLEPAPAAAPQLLDTPANPPPSFLPRTPQADLVSGGFMKAPPDAALADKAAAKARKIAGKQRGGGGAKRSDGGASQHDFRRYSTPGGLSVLVGRNSRQNDEISCRLAQPRDVWMHARGVPGAHVLLRVPAGSEAGDADLAFAADLAAFFSKARTSGKVDVTVCDPKHLSKPSGAKPGQVMVRKEAATLVGRPDSSAAAAAGETSD